MSHRGGVGVNCAACRALDYNNNRQSLDVGLVTAFCRVPDVSQAWPPRPIYHAGHRAVAVGLACLSRLNRLGWMDPLV